MPEEREHGPEPSLLYSPEHQQAVGRVVLAASGMEAAVVTILARLWEPPERAIRDLAGKLAGEHRKLLKERAERKLQGRLQREVLGWLDRVHVEAERRNRLVHATWYRVDKPEPGSVAFAHYGREAADAGYAKVEQVALTDLQRMGMVIDSVAGSGLFLLGKVEDFLAGRPLPLGPGDER